MIGIIYFLVIIFANSVGAISGMGGGVIIKPILDFVDADSVAAISFYSTIAVFTMSVVSTTRQVKRGITFDWKIILRVASGAIVGGVIGNQTLDYLLSASKLDASVQLIQIGLTIFTLIFAFLYTQYPVVKLELTKWYSFVSCGLLLGFLASLLGIGGGPINVSLLMLMFSFPIKEATVYSICIIFFSQLAKLLTIGVAGSYLNYDLSRLFFIIPAAVLGGLIGAKLSGVLSQQKVTIVFQGVIILVMIINLYNGFQLLSKFTS